MAQVQILKLRADLEMFNRELPEITKLLNIQDSFARKAEDCSTRLGELIDDQGLGEPEHQNSLQTWAHIRESLSKIIILANATRA